MKKIGWLLLLILSTSARAEQTKTTFNPYTGKFDFITAMTTNTIVAGSGVTTSCTAGACTINSSGGGGAALPFPAGATNYVQVTDTLQSGSTFYVSSGTVGPFQIKSGADTWQFIPNASSNRVLYFSSGAQFDISDGDSANGGTALVTYLFANGTTNSVNGISKPAMIVDTGDLALQGAQAGFKIKQKSFGNNYVGFQSSATVTTSTWTLPTKFAPGVWQERALGQIDNTALSLATGPVVGILPAANMPALTGDVTTAAGAVATTAAAIQGNVRTFTSSITVTGAGGIGATYGVLSGSVTTGIVQVSSNSVLANTTFYQDGTIIMGSTTIKAAATDYILSVSSANAIVLFGFQDNGGFVSSGTLPTLSSCGTGPALSVGSSNFSGTITGGSTSGGCTLTFASGGFTNVPTCVISNQTMSVVNAMTYTVSTTALTVTETGLGTSKIDYICLGH